MIVLLAGGTGGAKLARGLAGLVEPQHLAIIANTGDDFFRYGLRICPDVDSLLYLLAGKLNPKTGWGRAGETFQCLAELEALGGSTWFQIGDRDLALHLIRNQLLEESNLTDATAELARRLGVGVRILPMTDGYLPTFLDTDQGRLHMQEYFVRERCRPRVKGLVACESPPPVSAAVEAAVEQAQRIVLGPSNPFISIGPILRTPGFDSMLRSTRARVLAVSPIVGGRALKGPTAKMLSELGYPVSVVGIAQVYDGLVDCLVIDESDRENQPQLEARGLEVVVTDTVMSTPEAEKRLARLLLEM